MFTGLVEEAGQLAARTPKGPSARLSVRCALPKLELGESIAVDGVCLTVDTITHEGFEADASAETLARTTLGFLPVGAKVNLERALAVGQRLGGHIVSGHVDGTGHVVERTAVGDAVKVTFRAPKELLRFIAEKGSITVSGVSLTVNGVGAEAGTFDVMLIPHTLSKTSLQGLAAGDTVNLEVDVLARYVARLLEAGSQGADGDANAEWMARLARAGML
jgi:riboflavin synthase